MGKLDKKVAIITGGGTGIGQSIALTFAKEGADVVVCGRTMANLEGVVNEIKGIEKHVIAVQTDVSVKKQVQDMVKGTIEEFGQVDILVNNAGVARRGLIVDISEEDWDYILDINLKGTFLCIQAVAKHMMERKCGKIINISSIAGIRCIFPSVASYCVSKAGINLLTKAATLELAPYGISVNAIAPGFVETLIYRRGRTPEQMEQWRSASRQAPIGRVGEPDDIAKVALFLASDDSSFVSGECIVVDGGRNAKL